MSLQAIQFDRRDKSHISVRVLDQLLLPYVSRYIPIHTVDDGFAVIRSMQVRGAPAIAIVAVLSVLAECQLLGNEAFVAVQAFYDLSSYAAFGRTMRMRLAHLLASRPTAVNLAHALRDVERLLDGAASLSEFRERMYDYACELLDTDVANNVRMGDNGARFLLDALIADGFDGDFAVLTICNTGSLATAGYGTALGAIRSLWQHAQAGLTVPKKQKASASAPRMTHVFPLETRPYNQGSRLTAYELLHDAIPATLITDSSVAYRIQTSSVPIKAAFVGADRIARNGDTANKIGTLQLALLCRHFGIQFFVVAPRSTVDGATAAGSDILVEERRPDEFRIVTGAVAGATGDPAMASVAIAPPDMPVWNPAFDVTPHAYIDAIVTESGVFTKDAAGNFNLDELFT
ncbi:AaceriAAR098Wp [[Ashbya] aceris (nom. inval.)]|nr:AaceriAAR098Wp [[Ashbya] aceris (nom. inval.)]